MSTTNRSETRLRTTRKTGLPWCRSAWQFHSRTAHLTPEHREFLQPRARRTDDSQNFPICSRSLETVNGTAHIALTIGFPPGQMCAPSRVDLRIRPCVTVDDHFQHSAIVSYETQQAMSLAERAVQSRFHAQSMHARTRSAIACKIATWPISLVVFRLTHSRTRSSQFARLARRCSSRGMEYPTAWCLRMTHLHPFCDGKSNV